jgi:hypothetical protein
MAIKSLTLANKPPTAKGKGSALLNRGDSAVDLCHFKGASLDFVFLHLQTGLWYRGTVDQVSDPSPTLPSRLSRARARARTREAAATRASGIQYAVRAPFCTEGTARIT